MNIVLTQFAVDSHFDPARAGTVITDQAPEQFEREVNKIHHPEFYHLEGAVWVKGYAPFCKLLFLPNWTNARTGTLPITNNESYLKSAYKARKDDELPVLVRWLELPKENIPEAKYLCLVLYNKEQLAEEGTDIGDADWGVVAILGQMHSNEEPMTPMTAIRNALGKDEGGSGVPLDREAYMKSVDFWRFNATVKIK